MTRLAPGGVAGLHRVGNTMPNGGSRFRYRYPMRDPQSGMWAFRGDLLARLHVIHDGMPFSEELKAEVLRRGYRYLEVPIDYRERSGEKKIRSFNDAFLNFFWLFRKRFGWVPAAA